MKNHPILYPFTAIVGQEELKTALMLCAINPAIGGLLIQGDKGAAKSTAARALSEIVPPILKVNGCAFNCTPEHVAASCERCTEESRVLEEVNIPFINLPIGATEERILGSLDLEAVLISKQKKFQPGLLAAVHQGVLYIDEVNLLPDHLVDILLDVAAQGENYLERDGLSLRHPSRFSLIGTMNPEEGQLRPQFLDRFGLMVQVAAPSGVAERTEVVRRRIAFESDAAAFCGHWESAQLSLSAKLRAAKTLLPSVSLSEEMLSLISRLTTAAEVKSLRADLVIYKTAITLAALDQRKQVEAADIHYAALLALAHRSRKGSHPAPGSFPSQQDQARQADRGEQEKDNAQERDGVQERNKQQPEQDKLPQEGAEQQQGQKWPVAEQELPAQPSGGLSGNISDSSTRETETAQRQASGSANAEPDAANRSPADAAHHQKNDPAEQTVQGQAGMIRQLSLQELVPDPLQHLHQQVQGLNSGKRIVASQVKRGHAAATRRTGEPGDLAVVPTVLQAVTRDSEALSITRDDLHYHRRSGKVSSLILFVVDASGSMSAKRRMEAVKGTVLSLLEEAQQKRDLVGVIAFRGIEATVLLAPTQRTVLAEEALRELATGGRTPLPHALQVAEKLLRSAISTGVHPVLVLLTDGKANVPLSGGTDPWSQTMQQAAGLSALQLPSVVINSDHSYLNLGKARELAECLGANYLSLDELSAEALRPVVSGLLQRI